MLICSECSHERYGKDCYGCDFYALKCCRCHADLIYVERYEVYNGSHRATSPTGYRTSSPVNSVGSGRSNDSGVSVPPNSKKKWPKDLLASFQQDEQSADISQLFTNNASKIDSEPRRAKHNRYFQAVVSGGVFGYGLLQFEVGDIFTAVDPVEIKQGIMKRLIFVCDKSGNHGLVPSFSLREIDYDQYVYMSAISDRRKFDIFEPLLSSHDTWASRAATGDVQPNATKRQKVNDICNSRNGRKFLDCSGQRPACQHCQYSRISCCYGIRTQSGSELLAMDEGSCLESCDQVSRSERGNLMARGEQEEGTRAGSAGTTESSSRNLEDPGTVDVSEFLKERALEPVAIVEAVCSYTVRDPLELSIVEGDRIYVLAWSDDCTWARIEKDNKFGVVPQYCLGNVDFRQYTPYS